MLLVIILPMFAIASTIFMVVLKKCRKRKETSLDNFPDFSVAEYLERLENTAIQILEEQKDTTQEITLWLGLDGLQLNENGERTWISRGKKKEVEWAVTGASVSSIDLDWTIPEMLLNGTRYIAPAHPYRYIDLTSMQVEADQCEQNANIINVINAHVAPISPYDSSILNCCCSFNDRK